MKKLFLLFTPVMALTLAGCDQHHDKKTTPPQTQSSIDSDKSTSRNVTPFDQSETEADRTITQRARQAIIKDDALSMNAKNIKIITSNGIVTLRGPVSTDQEKSLIAIKIQQVPGVNRIDNQLEVLRNH